MLPNFLCRPLIMLFGILYPGYMSYKVLKTKRSTNYGIWLMYWITFSVFTSVETIADMLIGTWLPFYNELKLLLLYMTYPTSDSSLSYIYINIISPFIKRHEKDIDAQIKHFKNGGLQTLMTVGKNCTNILMNIILSTLQSYGFQVGSLNNINVMNMNIIEKSEPDGCINWEEVINNDDDDDSSSSSSISSLGPGGSEYSFSEMFGPAETNDIEIKYDPPSKNTRRRKNVL